MLKAKLFFFLLFPLIVSLNAQVVYQPVNSEVYNFLDRLSIKKIIQYNSGVKPLPRTEIAILIKQASLKQNELNSVDKEEINFYLREYASELKLENERWYLLKHDDSLFSIRVSPLIGLGLTGMGNKTGHVKWPGVSFYGTYSNWFGAFFKYVDYGEFGDFVDVYKVFTPKTGAYNKTSNDGIEYSDVRGSISFNWSWGSVSILKDYNMWGSGRFGQLFISTKAPSYPHIKLELKPASWFKFYYFHGWLNSEMLDSTRSYYSHTESSSPFLLQEFRTKFIAANYLVFSPWDWLDFSAGNSYVYTGNVKPETFIPFMYYKVLDHNTGREGFGDGNGQIFFNLDVKYPKNYLFYSSLLIDVLELKHVLQGKFYTSWFAFTLGGKTVDLFADNLDLTLEYTKTNPWIYENKNQAVDYKHMNFYLGHWIGQNADLLDVLIDYKIFRGLKISGLFELFRKGGMNDIITAYVNKQDLPFLYGEKRIDKKVKLEISYEYIHDLFIKAYYQYSEIKDDNPLRTENIFLGAKNSFQILLSYGI